MNREVPKEQQRLHCNDHTLMRIVYENLQSMGWIPPRKLAVHLRLQEFPGQTNHPGAGCRRVALYARPMDAGHLLT